MRETTEAAGDGYQRAARVFYDTIAADYADHFRDESIARPLDRAMLDAFAELVGRAGGGPVADVGCGPGQAAGYLAARGLTVVGLDLAPAMVALAAARPGVRGVHGSMSALGVRDGGLAGIVAWWSLIHVPPDRHPAVLAELRRALAPGGYLLAAFQVGDEPLRVEDPFGHPVALDFHRLAPDRVAELMDGAGLTVEARMVRAPSGREAVPQAAVLGRRRP